MALQILIVDDEPLARLRLRGLIDAIVEPRCEVVAEAATASQASSWLREHRCDVLLLDVQMPGADGLQFADGLAQRPAGTPSPLVIFVTAHAAHALRAFELEALDYLTKPVRRERLQAALARAEQRLRERAAAQAQTLLSDGAMPESDFLTLSDRGRLRRIPLAEVLYFRAEQKYVTLRTASETQVMDGTLAEVEQRWPDRFLRIHRNALVAPWAVRELQRHAATNFGELDDGSGESGDNWAVRIVHVDEWLAVSRRQVAAVRDALAGQGR